MLRKRFLVEGLGSVKKFHSLTKDSSERESREKRDEMEGEDLRVGFDKGTVCPGKEESCIKKTIVWHLTWREQTGCDILQVGNLSIPDEGVDDDPHQVCS